MLCSAQKKRYPFILPEIEPELFAYMGATIKRHNGIPFIINGARNHVHVFSTLPKMMTVPKFVEELKRNSSRWIKTKGKEYQKFAWQNGYGAFSVSTSKNDALYNYIASQKEHHKNVSFEDEFLRFLKEYHLDYDERYIWD